MNQYLLAFMWFLTLVAVLACVESYSTRAYPMFPKPIEYKIEYKGLSNEIGTNLGHPRLY